MSFAGIAAQAGTLSPRIEQLINNGEGSPGLASRLGTTSSRITDFINGEACPAIAQALGGTMLDAQLLRHAIGREGAIGLILGLACGRAGIEDMGVTKLERPECSH
jgi:hypothetical protein